MDEIKFEQLESEKQKKEAGSLIREYLEWLNDRLRRDYGMEFDVEAMEVLPTLATIPSYQFNLSI